MAYGIATSYELNGPSFESRQGQENSFCPKPSLLVLAPTQLPVQSVPVFFFLGR
jgi:hypothetical protein